MPHPLLKSSVLVPTALTSLLALTYCGSMVAEGTFDFIRIAVALYVLGMGIWTVWYVFRGSHDFALLAGAFGLAVAGAFGANYGLLQTADPEYWAIMFCTILVAQGGFTINYLWIRKSYA